LPTILQPCREPIFGYCQRWYWVAITSERGSLRDVKPSNVTSASNNVADENNKSNENNHIPIAALT